MAPTIQLYDHTIRRFAEGSFIAADTYRVMLCSAVTFDAANTTLASIVRTEIAESFGYVAGGLTLPNVTITTVGTNGAKFDADDPSVTATGGSIAAGLGILYNFTKAGSPPLARLDFDEVITASNGVPFIVEWDESGIITWALAV